MFGLKFNLKDFGFYQQPKAITTFNRRKRQILDIR